MNQRKKGSDVQRMSPAHSWVATVEGSMAGMHTVAYMNGIQELGSAQPKQLSVHKAPADAC